MGKAYEKNSEIICAKKNIRKIHLKRVVAIALSLSIVLMMSACSKVKTTDSTKSNDTGSGKSEISEEYKDIFTERDLEQATDLSEAQSLALESGKDISITNEGVYLLSGEATDVTVYIDAGDGKVQLVLDTVTITNDSKPCIYATKADKVFITTTESVNALTVDGQFVADGDTNTDAVIFSKSDVVINGTGTLNITSADNAVSSKDKLKVTGSTINISCSGNALEAHDGVYVADGTINVSSCNDGIHAKDSDDDTKGEVYIAGGTITINANDDAIHATTIACIDEGVFKLTAQEGIEATVITINGGKFNIEASDDGINAASKSSSYTPSFELNGGEVVITMGQGDTDGVDVNGNIYINGGTIDITGQSTFDYDGTAEYNGGTIIENGTETNTITNQFFGGKGGRGQDGNFQRPNMDENGNFQPPNMDENGNMQPPQPPNGDFDPREDGDLKNFNQQDGAEKSQL